MIFRGSDSFAGFEGAMKLVPQPANNDDVGSVAWNRNPKILEWLNRFTQSNLAFDTLGHSLDRAERITVEISDVPVHTDDWQAVANICGYGAEDFAAAGATLPLTVAEIEHFRRNHRCTESNVHRDFLTAKSDLPSPLAELYGLYQHRARLDAEATLFLAQSTTSMRVARMTADLLAIGAFANGMEFITHMGLTYSVPAAFDTSGIIDSANNEAARRLALPAEHPSHLLKLTPDEIGILAMELAEKNTLSSADFLEKANLLAEARQDVNRLPVSQHFTTAFTERDLPHQYSWVMRICAAYGRVFESWVSGIPETQALLQ